MERRDLYQNDLTEEDLPSPAERDDAAHDLHMDPDILPRDDDENDAPSVDRPVRLGEPLL